jgi:hypothetical protein
MMISMSTPYEYEYEYEYDDDDDDDACAQDTPDLTELRKRTTNEGARCTGRRRGRAG